MRLSPLRSLFLSQTQIELLRLLRLLSRHFAAASLSLTVTRSFDAVRILTMVRPPGTPNQCTSLGFLYELV